VLDVKRKKKEGKKEEERDADNNEYTGWSEMLPQNSQ